MDADVRGFHAVKHVLAVDVVGRLRSQAVVSRSDVDKCATRLVGEKTQLSARLILRGAFELRRREGFRPVALDRQGEGLITGHRTAWMPAKSTHR